MNRSAEEVDQEAFGQFLKNARAHFDYIFLDAPAGIDAGFALAARFARRIILVTLADPAAVRDATRAGQRLELMGKTDVRLVVNRVDRDVLNAVRQTIDDVMDSAGLPLIGIVPEDPNVVLAATFGHSVLQYAKRCPAAKAYRNIAMRIRGYTVPVMKK